MSVELKVGRVSREVNVAISDSVCSNLLPILKNDMNLNNDQIKKILAVVQSTVETTGINAVNQYVSLFNEIKSESEPSKKSKIFG